MKHYAINIIICILLVGFSQSIFAKRRRLRTHHVHLRPNPIEIQNRHGKNNQTHNLTEGVLHSNSSNISDTIDHVILKLESVLEHSLEVQRRQLQSEKRSLLNNNDLNLRLDSLESKVDTLLEEIGNISNQTFGSSQAGQGHVSSDPFYNAFGNFDSYSGSNYSSYSRVNGDFGSFNSSELNATVSNSPLGDNNNTLEQPQNKTSSSSDDESDYSKGISRLQAAKKGEGNIPNPPASAEKVQLNLAPARAVAVGEDSYSSMDSTTKYLSPQIVNTSSETRAPDANQLVNQVNSKIIPSAFKQQMNRNYPNFLANSYANYNNFDSMNNLRVDNSYQNFAQNEGNENSMGYNPNFQQAESQPNQNWVEQQSGRTFNDNKENFLFDTNQSFNVDTIADRLSGGYLYNGNQGIKDLDEQNLFESDDDKMLD